MLFGLCKFSECDEFLTAQTCTQTPQTFYHAKKHLGLPVKAENLLVDIFVFTYSQHSVHLRDLVYQQLLKNSHRRRCCTNGTESVMPAS